MAVAEIVAVAPAVALASTVTSPVDLTVATEVLLLVHSTELVTS